jgi:hypothetical protein
MLDNAQYVCFRQGHGWRRICQVQSCKERDGDVVIEYKNGEETVARTQIGLGNVDNPIVVKNMSA